MSDAREHLVTRTLQAAAGGDPKASAELLPLVYDELRKLAGSRLAHLPPGQTLQPTALVHEAYLRVMGDADAGWDSRGHFFAAAARAIRNILVDQARRKNSLKHGGNRKKVELDETELRIEPPSDDLLAIHEAVELLEADDPRKGQIVELRYFAGLTEKDTAAALGLTVGTIKHEWRFIRRWLFQRVRGRSTRGDGRKNGE